MKGQMFLLLVHVLVGLKLVVKAASHALLLSVTTLSIRIEIDKSPDEATGACNLSWSSRRCRPDQSFPRLVWRQANKVRVELPLIPLKVDIGVGQTVLHDAKTRVCVRTPELLTLSVSRFFKCDGTGDSRVEKIFCRRR